MTDDQRPGDADLTRRHDASADPAATPPADLPPIAPLTPGVERYSPPADDTTTWSRHDASRTPVRP